MKTKAFVVFAREDGTFGVTTSNQRTCVTEEQKRYVEGVRVVAVIAFKHDPINRTVQEYREVLDTLMEASGVFRAEICRLAVLFCEAGRKQARREMSAEGEE